MTPSRNQIKLTANIMEQNRLMDKFHDENCFTDSFLIASYFLHFKGKKTWMRHPEKCQKKNQRNEVAKRWYIASHPIYKL